MTPATLGPRTRRHGTGRRAWAAAGLALALPFTGACTGGGSGGADDGTVTVAAASSLQPAFEALAADLAERYPDLDLRFTFDSSTTLATQILEGAPVDVFAAADAETMDRLVAAGSVDEAPFTLAHNQMTIITKPGNPDGIATAADLADAGVIALCGADVPCGRLAQRVLTAAGVAVPESRVTRGQNAAATTAAVAEGDAVAGIVYVTDAVAAGSSLTAVPIPSAINATTSYQVAVLAASREPELARKFVEYLTTDDAAAVLVELGFQP